jgi:hypothetical protein
MFSEDSAKLGNLIILVKMPFFCKDSANPVDLCLSLSPITFPGPLILLLLIHDTGLEFLYELGLEI